MHKKQSVFQKISIVLIRVYQCAISPIIGGRATCRFIPTCSEYAKQAIEKHGAIRGTVLAIKRISRCRPGGKFGYDPVP
jgi:putative membrane protein insertion efficiency factor